MPAMRAGCFALFLCGALAARGGDVSLEALETLAFPGSAPEIVHYDSRNNLLLAIDNKRKALAFWKINGAAPKLSQPVALLPLARWPDVSADAEITSVDVHPTLPLALVTVTGGGPEEASRLVALDLHGGLVRVVASEPAGKHTDSVAISPDGRWALVANEAEGSPDTEGDIWAFDLSTFAMPVTGRMAKISSVKIAGLGEVVRDPPGTCEPEFVAFDPASRFAAVSLQENDAVVFVDCQGTTPKVAGGIALPRGSLPDGVAILDDVPGPDGRIGCLVGIAEEGDADPTPELGGQSVGFYWVDPAKLSEPAVSQARLRVGPFADPEKPDKRYDPEGITLQRLGGRIFALVTVERGDCLLGFDMGDPKNPQFVGRAKVGKRPEGLCCWQADASLFVAVANEGKDDEDGGLSLLRMR